MLRRGLGWLIAAWVCCLACVAQTAHSYRYFRVGNSADAPVTPRAGFALMGGGEDLDEAFRWLCERAGGGDLLVLRATGKDDYNPYIAKLCHLNSVATIVIPDKATAGDPFVASAIRHASALFISGGDQSKYVNYWTGTAAQAELNAAIERGVPVGGTSAGLAVLGEYAYSAQGDKPDDANLDGRTAMADPFSLRVTLVRGFLHVPVLAATITDTHFARRDRMGRLLVFLARLNQAGEGEANAAGAAVRGLGIEERAAVLLDADGAARVVGRGAAYVIDCGDARGVVRQGQPLTFGPYAVRKVAAGEGFNLKDGSGGGIRYTLSVEAGVIHSTQANGSVY